MIRTNQAALWLMASMIAALAMACSDPGTNTSTSSSGSGGAGGQGGTGGMTSSSSSSTGGGGAGGEAGSGGGQSYGHPATEIVNGGERMKSSNYTMVYTIGQPSVHQGTAKSGKYRMQGGLVGATESLP